MNEEWGVKSSLKEELDSSMKSDEKGLIKDKSQMSLTSCFCFIILPTNIVVPGIRIVS
jgi:hypothetical protein